METPFAGAIIALKQVRSDDLVKQLNAVFLQIGNMTTVQAIAAWQTLDVLLAAEIGDNERKLIDKFQVAIINRLSAVVTKEPFTCRLDKEKYVRPILDVIGYGNIDQFFR